MTNPWPEKMYLTRRSFLGRASTGFGSVALASLLNPSLLTGRTAAGDSSAPSAAKIDHWTGVVHPLHFTPKAKRVIYLYMAGGPSHLETLDHKPKLAEMHGQPMPESFTKGQPIAQLQNQQLKCLAPQHKFERFGQSGQEICSLFPHIGGIADDICIVRSMVTEAINHDPAHTFMNTGTTISGRPSMGSWLWYGLGSESEDLPGFVVLTSTGASGQQQPIASRQWHCGFLPSRFQCVQFRSKGDAVHYIRNPEGVTNEQQRDVVDAVERLNALSNDSVDDPEIATRITQYEMAFRMQTSVPGLMDMSGESAETLKLYGTTGTDGTFAANCLVARRLAERGVRFIQLYHRDWDHHGDLVHYMEICCGCCDRPAAALIQDLKQRGLLDETLIIWGGEFGRTPMFQGKGGPGRDHHIKGFSMWMAGGGVKGGTGYGATDDLGYNAVDNPVHIRDLHATILHLLGIDHERFSVKHQGLDMKLTGVDPARVVKDVLV
jgi:hypothetical protein